VKFCKDSDINLFKNLTVLLIVGEI